MPFQPTFVFDPYVLETPRPEPRLLLNEPTQTNHPFTLRADKRRKVAKKRKAAKAGRAQRRKNRT